MTDTRGEVSATADTVDELRAQLEDARRALHDLSKVGMALIG